MGAHTMAVQTAAGAKLYIGPANEDASDLTDYEALTYTAVGEVEDLGEFGDTAATTTFTALNDRRVRKLKTTFDAGTMQLTIGRDPDDDGQIAMKAALKADANYAFQVELSDGSSFYFRGMVSAFTTQVGNAENVVRASATIEVNSEVLEAAAGP